MSKEICKAQMTMSSTDESFFKRLSDVVDNHFKNDSDFCRQAGINRQSYSNWKTEYDEEGKEPNPKFETLQPVINTIHRETNVNIVWLLTGEGERYGASPGQQAIDLVGDHKKAVDHANSSELSPDDLAEYLLKNRKAVLEFLRSLE